MKEHRKVIYIELEDDITSLIQKIKESDSEIIALVPPQRTSLLQSAVNLRLVQKTALDKKKDIAVITEDQTVTTIAARIGMKTASNLETKAAVPQLHVPEQEIPSETIEESPQAKTEEPTEDSDSDKSDKPAKVAKTGAAAGLASRAKSKLKIPDFNRFKKRLLLGVLAVILLGAGWWLATSSMPTAAVEIQGRTENLDTEMEFTADTTLTEVNLENRVLPAAAEEVTKTLTTTFPATGERDVGERATGTITIRNCDDTDSYPLPAGTRFTAQNRTFLSDSAMTVPPGSVSGGSFSCSDPVSVGVTAENRGDQYNLAPTSYTSPSLSEHFEITGNQMSGGSSEVVSVVSRQDVDKAKARLLSEDKIKTQQELATRFGEGHLFLEESFTQEVLEETLTPGINEEADEGRIIVELRYVALSVNEADLIALLRHTQESEIAERSAEDRIGVVKEGLSEAEITLINNDNRSRQVYRLETTALLGPDFDLEELRAELAGQGYSEALSYLRDFPNVTGAEIQLSPFWVFSMPSRAENIDITLEMPVQSE